MRKFLSNLGVTVFLACDAALVIGLFIGESWGLAACLLAGMSVGVMLVVTFTNGDDKRVERERMAYIDDCTKELALYTDPTPAQVVDLCAGVARVRGYFK